MSRRCGRCMAPARKGRARRRAKREGEEPDEDRACHDERERRIPVAEDVEECDDLAGIGHTRDDEPDSENESGGEGGDEIHATCLVMKTVAMPAAMKAAVATSERGESRDSPHTPWPLVHPEP